jgi:hypothetical protein
VTRFRYSEARAILCGDLIGEGSARKVYELRTNSDYVIKIETAGRSFQNVSEWETWQWVSGGPLSGWFAPCEFISPCGLLLVQRKVEPLRVAELPPMLPAFLSDLKRENFGLLAKRVVCCDYGTAHSSIRSVSKRMRRATWR